MKNVVWVLTVGTVAGALDLIPLLMAGVPFFNMVAVVLFWLVTSFFIYRTVLFRNGLLNGLVVSLLLMLPLALTVSAVNPKDFFPMLSMAIILGPPAGWVLAKLR